MPLSVRGWFPQYEGLIAVAGITSWTSAILASGLAARMTLHIPRLGRLALLIWVVGALKLVALVLVSGFGVVAYLMVLFLLGANGAGKALLWPLLVRGTSRRPSPADRH